MASPQQLIHASRDTRKIVCISAGMLQPKKADNPIARMHLYLNYGLLGLASILEDAGHDTIVVHGRFAEPETLISELFGRFDPLNMLILLSVPSSFSLPWARRACAEARRWCSSLRIIVGGRWVVANDESWIRDQIPDASEFFNGLAEEAICGLVDGATRESAPNPNRFGDSLATIPSLRYELLEDWCEYQPSIEVSRGCGRGCSFCLEGNEPLSPLKDGKVLAREFEQLASIYASKEIHPYLEASHFSPTGVWVNGFRESLEQANAGLRWRAETRIDTIKPELVRQLAATGLRVLDLGLESASHAQLKRMDKTKSPEKYLFRASALLQACRDAGVWTKVNVLFYPGETRDTVNETVEWLERHRDAIKGLSVGPTILFRYGETSRTLLGKFESAGASVVDPNAIERDGYAHLHMSKDLSYQATLEVAKQLSQSFMSARDYFDLKSFSYLPRSVSWARFCELLKSNENVEYSFRALDGRQERQPNSPLNLTGEAPAS